MKLRNTATGVVVHTSDARGAGMVGPSWEDLDAPTAQAAVPEPAPDTSASDAPDLPPSKPIPVKRKKGD